MIIPKSLKYYIKLKQFRLHVMKMCPTGDGNPALNPEEFGSHIQKLAEEANKVLSEQTLDPEVSATIAQSLRSLSEDAGNIQVLIFELTFTLTNELTFSAFFVRFYVRI